MTALHERHSLATKLWSFHVAIRNSPKPLIPSDAYQGRRDSAESLRVHKHAPMVDIEVIVRLQDQEHCASITSMIS